MIHQVKSLSEFNELITTKKYDASIVEYTASWYFNRL